MPITITQPTTGQPFGPGFVVDWSTDRIGPEPPGTRWVSWLEAPIGEDIWMFLNVPFVSPITRRIMLSENDERSFVMPVEQVLTTGSAARLRVQLVAPTTTVLEQTTVDVVVDRQQGQAYELYKAITTNPTVAAPTLTEEEHNAVLQTNTGVIAMSGFNITQLVGDLGAALSSGPPLGIGSLSGPYDITGDGELPDLHPPFQDRLGVYWVATTIPDGLSHRHGQSEEYPNRLVQWRTVHVVGGSEMVTEVLDATTHGELWQFQKKLPERVEYSVLPGVVIRARWWQFP